MPGDFVIFGHYSTPDGLKINCSLSWFTVFTSSKIKYWKDFFQQNHWSSTSIKKKKGHINVTESFFFFGRGGTGPLCPQVPTALYNADILHLRPKTLKYKLEGVHLQPGWRLLHETLLKMKTFTVFLKNLEYKFNILFLSGFYFRHKWLTWQWEEEVPPLLSFNSSTLLTTFRYFFSVLRLI